MNNKGFAITSIIYGLAILGLMIVVILMGTLSSTRNNVSEEAKAVEEFLINFNQTEVTYRGNGGSVNYIYTIPNGESGWYRFEAFGRNSAQARGAYTTGIMYANAGDKFKITIDSASSEVEHDSTLLMRAQAANGVKPGGTVKCYSTSSVGGNINMNTFKLQDTSKTFTGIDGVTLSNCSNGTYILGHPSSYTGTNDNYSYYFVDGLMLAGANGGSDGKVIITRLAERDETISNIPRKNTKFNNVNSIYVTSSIPVSKINYSYHGNFNNSSQVFTGTIKSCTPTSGGTNVYVCNGVGNKNLDDISIMFDGQEKKNAQNVTVKLNNDNSKIIYQSNGKYGVTIGATGLHFSAYQPDSYTGYSDYRSGVTNNFAVHGNYYLIPVVSEGMVVSALSNAADDANQLKIEGLTGESRQKWAIDLISYPVSQDPGQDKTNFPNIVNESGKREYRIMELTRYKALNIYYDENYKMNFVSASETFNSLSRNAPQIWNIFPLNDGTYAIKTVVPSFTLFEKSGFLFAKPGGVGPNNINDVMIGLVDNNDLNDGETMPTQVERFILYSLDFSK